MKKTIIFLMCYSLGLLMGCRKHLDVQPRGRVIPQTSEQYSIILQRQLESIDKGTDETILGNASTIVQYEFFSDNLDPALATTVNSGTPLYVGFRINEVQDTYRDAYDLIKDYNVLIGEMKDRDSELARKLLGTSYALRGINYYNLLIRFCEPYQSDLASGTLGLPIVNEFNMEAKPARASLQETVDFILNDFQQALSYNVNDKDYLFTTDVVKAYMARLYFWVHDWDNAIKYADEVLQNYPVTTADQYLAMVNAKIEKKENMIVRSYTVDSENGAFIVTATKSDIFTRPASKEFVETFLEKEDDIRYLQVFDKKWFATKTPTAAIKSEEMVLILAESYAHNNNTTQALAQLNNLRANRIQQNYIPYTENNLPDVYSQLIKTDALGNPLTPLLSAILCERRKELFMEGDRFFELKRNGRPEFWIPYEGRKYIMDKYLYTFPIYKRDVDLQPLLIIQNEGYFN